MPCPRASTSPTAGSSTGRWARPTGWRTRRSRNCSAESAGLAAHDGDEGDHLARVAAQVVGHGQASVARGDLALGWGFAAQLQPALEEHAQARGAHGVSEALQAAVGVDRKVAIEVER